MRSFEHPAIGAAFPVNDGLTLEEDRDLALGALWAIRPVDEVAANLQAEVTTNRAWRRLGRSREAHRLARGLHGAGALEDGGDDGAARDVVDEPSEERLANVP